MKHTMGYYSAIKKCEIMPFAATRIDLEIIILREVKSEIDKLHVISLLCGILRYDTNEHIYETETYSQT